jgi:hypothetical protein
MMSLIPTELATTIPPLYATEKDPEAKAVVKLFTPWTYWSWFVIEFDPHTLLCFGLVKGTETELGYFNLKELEKLEGPLELCIERDLYFNPKPWRKVKEDLDAGLYV